MRKSFAVRTAPAIFVLLIARAGGAQTCHAGSDTTPSLVMVASATDDALRRAALAGSCRGSLIRSPLTLSRPAGSRPSPIGPHVNTIWNSSIPMTMNDGALWAGRGANIAITGGLRWDSRFATIVIAPEIVASQNRGFAIIPSSNPARSEFASPWHDPPVSADIPLRFGADPFAQLSLGQTVLEAHRHGVALGFTTESEWWGPGIRNAIVMSNNAAGVPRLYLRTAAPWSTPLGDWEARLELGALSRSRFFEDSPGGFRSLSAAIVTLRVPFDTGLTLGVARAVYAQVSGAGALAGHATDVLWRWNQHGDLSYSGGHRNNQISSLFFQWVIPGAGFEVYGEWARLVPLRSLTELVVNPQNTQGFSVGWQWLQPVSTTRSFRLQVEATTLEQTPPTPGEAVPWFYTSQFAPEGYTQRGQVIGAAIGPGSSSQFIGADLLRGRSTLGLELGRIRWEDEAYYRQESGRFSYRHHDVSLFAGLRGGRRLGGVDIDGEMVVTQRNNFLFQSHEPVEYDSAFDMHNLTLRLTATPARIR